jgi:hypothetical protein
MSAVKTALWQKPPLCWCYKKIGAGALVGRGSMTSLLQRQTLCDLITTTTSAGARLRPACEHAGITIRTWQRWHRPDQTGGDRRRTGVRVATKPPPNKLSDGERPAVLIQNLTTAKKQHVIQ